MVSARRSNRLRAAAAARVTPGELRRRAADADQPRLRVADRRRCQSQREGRRVVPEGRARAAWKTGMPLLRLQGERVTQPNVFDLVSPNMFAGSILDLEPDTAYEARFVLTDPDGVSGPAANATKTVTVRTRPEPKPAAGGKVYHVYPVGYTGAEDRAGVHRHHVRLQLLLRRRRHRAGRTAAREAGRHHPGPRRHLRVSLRALRQPDHDQRDDDVRGDLLPDRRRHAGEADRDQGGGRRRGDHRRPRQLQSVQRQGRRLQLLRRDHLQEHRHRDLGGHAVHRRLEGADGQALPVRAGRHGRVLELLGLEQLLHRRQRVPRPQRSEASDRMERRVLGAVQRRRRAGVSADHEVVHRHPALRPRPRRRLQLRRGLSRRHRHRDVRHARRLACARRPGVSAARVLGSPAGGDRHLQQLHHQRARQLDRDGRQHAQHPPDAERADQLGVASDVARSRRSAGRSTGFATSSITRRADRRA